MTARTLSELWESILGCGFDDPIRDAIDNGKSATFGAGEPSGGIWRVINIIQEQWTVRELERFIIVWNDTPFDEKERLMGGATKPTDSADADGWAAWCATNTLAYRRVKNLTAALRSTYEAALIAIGAKCYADCKRDNTHYALALDREPYYNQTLAEIEKTLPPPLFKMLQGIANETQAAANLNAKNTKDLAAKFDKTASEVKDDLAGLKRQGENNGRTLAEVHTETAIIAATMPDQDQWAQLLAALKASKKPDKKVTRVMAATMLDLLCGRDSRFANLTGQTIGNWVRKGYCPHAPAVPLTEADLATKAAFVAWVQTMYAKVTAPKSGQFAADTSTIDSAGHRREGCINADNPTGWRAVKPDWCGLRPNLAPEVMRQIQAL